MPLVSIIIPVYNCEKYLDNALKSAINQTWPDIEIIVIDDGSTDGSLIIANTYKSEKIKVFSQKNTGSGFARNRGLQKASGEYIQFLDADDLLGANKIADQLQDLLKNPGKVAVCSTVHFLDGENPFINTPSEYEDAFLHDCNNPIEFLTNLYGGNDNRGSMIQTGAWLTPVDVIKRAGYWSEFYSPDDDGEFFCRVVLASSGIAYTKTCFNYYRKFENNFNLASIKTSKALRGKFLSFLLKKQYLLNVADNLKTKKVLAHSAMELAVDSYLVDKRLYTEIINVIKELGGTTYVPILGGRKAEFIKKIFGWRITKLLQHTLK